MLTFGVAAAQTPLTFQDALSLVDQSPRVVLAAGQLELAQEQLNVSASWLQTELASGYTRRSTRSSAADEASGEGSGVDPITLSAVFNVVPYGPRYDQTRQQRFGVERAQATLRNERAEVAIDVTEQYQNALRAGQQISLSQAQLELRELLLEAERTRLGAGTATTGDVLEAEIAVQEALQDLLDAERNEVQAFAALTTTLGVAVSEVAGDLPTSSFEAEPSEGLLELRSEITDARLGVAEAELTAASTLRENLPSGTLDTGFSSSTNSSTLQLGAQYSLNGPNAYQPTLSFSIDPDTGVQELGPGQDAQSFSVGIGVRVPLDVALNDALDAARLNVEQSQLRLEQALTLARLEVSNQQAAVATAEANIDLAEQVLGQRQTTLQMTGERLELGLVSPLDVQQATVSVQEAELTLAQARDTLRLAHMRYAAALALEPLEVF